MGGAIDFTGRILTGMGFSKLSEIMTYGETHQMPFWQVILEDDCRERNVSESQSLEAMEELLEAMEMLLPQKEGK